MFDPTISSTTAAATFLWLLGLVLIVSDILTAHQTGQLGLYAAGAGGVLNIRGFFCQLKRREMNAFELGRDHGKAADVRTLR